MAYLIADVMTDLGIELEDPNETKYDTTVKTRYYNKAQKAIVPRLHPNNRRILDVSQEDVSLTVAGVLDLTTLTNPPYQTVNGIDSLRLSSNDEPIKLMSIQQHEDFLHVNHVFSTDDPRYTIRGNTINVYPFSDVAEDLTKIDFFGFREPRLIVYHVTPSSSVTCELIDEVEEIMIQFTAFLLLSTEDKDSRAVKKFDTAMNFLAFLNTGKPLTESKGVNRLSGQNRGSLVITTSFI